MKIGLGRRLVQLYAGLALYGLSGALLVRSKLGLDPWDVLHQGIANRVGLQIGTVVIIVGGVVLLAWIPLRQRPGLGTLSNVVLVGASMNLCLDVLPHLTNLAARYAETLSGIVFCAVASGLYIGARFGPGPRDGLMTGLSKRTGRSIRATRTTLELSVLFSGWLLGGTVGIGTVMFAISIGPLVQFFLPIFDTSSASGSGSGSGEAAAEAADQRSLTTSSAPAPANHASPGELAGAARSGASYAQNPWKP